MPTIHKDDRALTDLDAIYEYIGVQNHSRRAADRFMDDSCALSNSFGLENDPIVKDRMIVTCLDGPMPALVASTARS